MDRSIIQRGFERYGQALSQLNRALDDPKAQQSSDILEAMGIMSLFEVSNLVYLRNWPVR